MGDCFSSVFLPDLEPSQVGAAHARVMTALIAAGVIARDQEPDSVLTPEGHAAVHRPGPAFCDLHEDRAYMDTTLSLMTNGMAACVGAAWNVREFQYIEAIVCPKCKTAKREGIVDFVGAEIMTLLDGKQMPDLTCAACGEASDARRWSGIEPLGLSYLGYEFWNWMPLDADGWLLDIPRLMADAAGSRVYVGGGKI